MVSKDLFTPSILADVNLLIQMMAMALLLGTYKFAREPSTCTLPRASIVNKALDRLVSAFSPSIVPTIYDSLDEIPKEEAAELKGRIAKNREK